MGQGRDCVVDVCFVVTAAQAVTDLGIRIVFSQAFWLRDLILSSLLFRHRFGAVPILSVAAWDINQHELQNATTTKQKVERR